MRTPTRRRNRWRLRRSPQELRFRRPSTRWRTGRPRSRGIPRIAIVDIDVHHGNGSQWMFYDDPSVLYISSHQFQSYPGTGAADEIGTGQGRGFTVNVPLEAGAN